MEFTHLWRHHLVAFGTGNMTLWYLSIVWLILDQIWWEWLWDQKVNFIY